MLTVCVSVIFAPLLVLDFFTTKWQHTSGWERLVDEVALPQHMPDMD
jgi:hypothetical protein